MSIKIPEFCPVLGHMVSKSRPGLCPNDEGCKRSLNNHTNEALGSDILVKEVQTICLKGCATSELSSLCKTEHGNGWLMGTLELVELHPLTQVYNQKPDICPLALDPETSVYTSRDEGPRPHYSSRSELQSEEKEHSWFELAVVEKG